MSKELEMAKEILNPEPSSIKGFQWVVYSEDGQTHLEDDESLIRLYREITNDLYERSAE